MISIRNWDVYASIAFYILTKFICFLFRIMYGRNSEPLKSIPENEEGDNKVKWVPKKKHEVLKAKYKCLKKLFQIYDASVIGILPDVSGEGFQETERRPKRKRSHRTKTDAYACTNELCNGDTSTQYDDKESSIESAVIRELNIKCPSSTQILTEPICEKNVSKMNIKESKNTLSSNCSNECECTQTLNYNHCNNSGQQMNHPINNDLNYPMPYLTINETHKPTRFQLLMQRIFGIRREKPCKNYFLSGHQYAASDNNISHHYDRRRQRGCGLRFRKIRRPKRCHSDLGMDIHSPAILLYVQTIQKSCLMDTTARQCPFVDCETVFYGIINYNDHLNLCHFPERKFTCHYCHEGFEHECDKLIHENEHLGLNKLNQHFNVSTTSTTKYPQRASITQTDPDIKTEVQEEKLKKIVSFFDKISDTDQILNEFKKNHLSGTIIQRSDKIDESQSESESSSTSYKRTMSCRNFVNRKLSKYRAMPMMSDLHKCPYEPIKCHICGENFDFRRQLSLHVDLEHRVHDKFSKFHSCAGIANHASNSFLPVCSTQMQLETGKINVQSSDLRSIKTTSSLSQDCEDNNSSRSLIRGPSTNIVYYESKHDKFNGGKIKSGIASYKWEPGTKIIRV